MAAPNRPVRQLVQRLCRLATWAPNHKKTWPWRFALFVNNVLDKRYVNGINNISATVLGTPFAYISPPRFWGLEVGVHF